MKAIRVAHVLDDTQLVLNVGSSDGIKSGQKFLVYGISKDEIIDPETGKPLGYLELVRGTGRIKYVQESMCILESDMFVSPLLVTSSLDNPGPKPFKSPSIGDHARELSSK